MLFKNKQVKFTSDGIKLSGILSYQVESRNPPGILFLHGGGQSSKERFSKWQNYLGSLGISSLAFDFRGVGESKGRFIDSSLKNRLADAKNAIKFFRFSGLVDPTKIGLVSLSGMVETPRL